MYVNIDLCNNSDISLDTKIVRKDCGITRKCYNPSSFYF